MIRPTASIRLTAGILTSLFAALGCGVDRADDPRSGDVAVAALGTPAAVSSTGLCDSKIAADGLLCSRCAGQPGAAPECLAASCTVENHCLRCTDPKGRTGVDCSIDYEGSQKGGYGSSGSTVSFASCSFVWGEPRTSGSTCQYPGGNTCEMIETESGTCMECRYPEGGGGEVCGRAFDPLYDPLINRPDDLPGPGACANDLSADGKVQCTTCVHADLSATRSCHYPGIIDCDLTNPADEAAGCVGRCRFKDGHEARICDSPRGIYPVPLP